jgi:hypothetical protein
MKSLRYFYWEFTKQCAVKIREEGHSIHPIGKE